MNAVDVAAWLRDLGLGRYAEAFRANDIDAAVLPELTAEDLVAIGVTSVGHRRKLLAAAAALRDRPPSAAGPPAPARPEPDAASAAAGPTAAAAERRQLTVLFCDLVGSTALAAGLDPEDLRGVISAYHATVAEVIARFGGHTAKYLGDGVLAYWGWPRAHEDATARAVRAGLALVDAVGRLSPHGVPALRVRVGIATGLVVVGDLIGAGAPRAEVVGETPNLAARLQALAAPGAVVVAGTTRRLIGPGFACEDLGERRLKGFPAPLRAWRVVDEAPAADAFEARRAADPGPLVGREPELARLLERWERAKAGRGQVVLLTGEAGIGKSRLAEALRERLAREGRVERRLACSPLHETSTLHPVLAHLERAAGLRRDDPPERKLERLEAARAPADAAAREAVPVIAGLLGIPTGGQRPQAEVRPQRRKERTLELLADHMLGRPPDRPLLVVFEDVYWADPTSLELLGRLVERVRALPALLIVTSRPGFAAGWSGQAHVLALPLGRLGRADGASLATAVAGGRMLPPELLEQIMDRTDGVPLFVEELTKAVLESGLLTDAGDRYVPAGPLPAPAIPETLRDSLMARLDRLGPAKRVAQIGAVIGQGFALDLLAAVVPSPPGELRAALAALLGAGLIRKAGGGARPAYAFKHALVREIAYETLLRERRRQLHARVAEVLERRFPDTQPELLARHHARAGATRAAVRCWLEAAELSLRRSAPVEAVAQLSEGLDLLATLPEDAERRRREIRLRLALGQALSLTEGRAAPEVGRAFGRARELCRREDDAPELVAALFGLYGFHFHRAELNEARAAADELLRLAEWRGDAAMQAVALGIGGSIAFFLGRLAAARSSLGAALADDADPAWRQASDAAHGFHPRLLSLTHLCWALLVLGHPDEARRRSRGAIGGAEAQPHRPAALAAALFSDGVVSQLVRDREAVRERAEALIALAGEQEFPLWLAGGTILRGWSLGDGDETGGAIGQMRRGLAAWRATGAEHLVPYFHALLAGACARGGRPAEGLRLVDEGLARAERTGERWCEAELLRLRGELLSLRAGRNRAAAEACLRRARAVARRQGARLWELRAAVSLARLGTGGGRRARGLVVPVYERFTEGFDTPDLRDARALLDELG
ncbi:MAG TPA: adenylate/guanylate cyclase domain-containing protein [Geminicoccaceae bacterium]|nr:adenylate/guanylate cyclase domain-containing protein [Geminicoccaceae bacterium]